MGQWEGELPGHCALPFNLPGAAQEAAGSGRFPSGLTRGRPSPRAFPGYSGFSRESQFGTRQRKRMMLYGCHKPREVSRGRMSPKSLEKPRKLTE